MTVTRWLHRHISSSAALKRGAAMMTAAEGAAAESGVRGRRRKRRFAREKEGSAKPNLGGNQWKAEIPVGTGEACASVEILRARDCARPSKCTRPRPNILRKIKAAVRRRAGAPPSAVRSAAPPNHRARRRLARRLQKTARRGPTPDFALQPRPSPASSPAHPWVYLRPRAPPPRPRAARAPAAHSTFPPEPGPASRKRHIPFRHVTCNRRPARRAVTPRRSTNRPSSRAPAAASCTAPIPHFPRPRFLRTRVFRRAPLRHPVLVSHISVQTDISLNSFPRPTVPLPILANRSGECVTFTSTIHRRNSPLRSCHCS